MRVEMRLPMVCAQCMQDDVMSAQIISSVTPTDDGRYQTLCPKGHRAFIVLQQQKFEVILTIAAHAIMDGYYREAVSSFSSGLELFYEFFVKTVLREKRIDEKELLSSWKLVSNQSERQLGAFVFVHTMEFNHSPALLNNTQVSFRNEVIHKGKIPSEREALEYGQAVLDLIRPILTSIKEKYPKAFENAIFYHLKGCREACKNIGPVATMSIPTIVSLSATEPGYDQRSIEEIIVILRRSSK